MKPKIIIAIAEVVIIIGLICWGLVSSGEFKKRTDAYNKVVEQKENIEKEKNICLSNLEEKVKESNEQTKQLTEKNNRIKELEEEVANLKAENEKIRKN